MMETLGKMSSEELILNLWMLPAIHVNVTSEWYHFEPLNVTCYSCECYLWMKSCWTSECGWTEYASVNWKVVAVRLNFLLYCVFSYVCNTKVTKIKLCTRSPWFMCQRLNWIPSRQLNRQVVVQAVCLAVWTFVHALTYLQLLRSGTSASCASSPTLSPTHWPATRKSRILRWLLGLRCSRRSAIPSSTQQTS